MNYLPFFVYGTLLPGQPNFMLWGQTIVTLEPARLVGAALYDLDWYPMLVDRPGSDVEGLLISVQPQFYMRVLARLDFLEGYEPAYPADSDYRRERRVITLAGGNPVVGWVYVGQLGLVTGRPLIQTNWALHLNHNRRQVGEWWQGVRTVGRDTDEARR